MRDSVPADKRTSKQTFRRLGATLIELAVTLTIGAVLITGMASAMLIATRALDNGTSPASNTSETGDIADQVTADLNFALTFSEQTSNAVTFTVPDRNADGNPETIRYAWSGAVGDPLTRQYNSGAAVPWAQDVRQFNLANLLRTVGPPPPLPEVESAEQVLKSDDDAPGGSFNSDQMGPDDWCSQYFMPTVPANAVHWKITRVTFRARKDGAAKENLAIEIRTADTAQKPTTTVIDSVALAETSLSSSYDWAQVSFSKLAGLDPTSGYCLVIKQTTTGGHAASIQFEANGSPMPANTHWMTSSDAGSSWTSPNSTQDMRFYIYGTVTTQ